MRCPICNKEMPIQRIDTSNNQAKRKRDYKEYKRVVYWCKQDDAWVSVETPLSKISTPTLNP